MMKNFENEFSISTKMNQIVFIFLLQKIKFRWFPFNKILSFWKKFLFSQGIKEI